MKKVLLSIFLTFTIISMLFLLNTFAQNHTQWELPDGAIARLGKGGVGDIKYSPDGRLLAVASRIGIWLYDATTLQEAASLQEIRMGLSACHLVRMDALLRLELATEPSNSGIQL